MSAFCSLLSRATATEAATLIAPALIPITSALAVAVPLAPTLRAASAVRLPLPDISALLTLSLSATAALRLTAMPPTEAARAVADAEEELRLPDTSLPA